MSLATVYRAFEPADAQLVRSRLEAAGFPAVVTHETATLTTEGYSAATGGILVQVPEDLAADARELIQVDRSRPA